MAPVAPPGYATDRLLSAARMATDSFSRNNATFTLVKAVGCSAAIGNAKIVGHRCVGQPEELRSEDHIT